MAYALNQNCQNFENINLLVCERVQGGFARFVAERYLFAKVHTSTAFLGKKKDTFLPYALTKISINLKYYIDYLSTYSINYYPK